MKTIKMRTFLVCFFLLIAGFSHAVDIESVDSYELQDRLANITEPGPPEIIDDMIIFTAPSGLRRVGIAFADEGFARVHWFRHLLIPRDHREISRSEKNSSRYKDSGVVFYVHQIPEGITGIDYRLVIDGLWTTDPANPDSRRDKSGLLLSTISIPPREAVPHPLNGPPGGLSFVFKGPPGETVTVAGNFNGWDPFMYELREGPSGYYSINIPLPPGKYQYVFFHKGQRHLDPYNSQRIYAKDGKAASEIVIQ